jgi:hypothetical protein
MLLKSLSVKHPHDVLPVDGRLTIFGVHTDSEWQCTNCGTVNPSPDSECPGKQEDEDA